MDVFLLIVVKEKLDFKLALLNISVCNHKFSYLTLSWLREL